jgi:hypothetical protein
MDVAMRRQVEDRREIGAAAEQGRDRVLSRRETFW